MVSYWFHAFFVFIRYNTRNLKHLLLLLVRLMDGSAESSCGFGCFAPRTIQRHVRFTVSFYRIIHRVARTYTRVPNALYTCCVHQVVPDSEHF